MQRTKDQKFVMNLNVEAMLAQGTPIGDVTTGECDFCESEATQGRKVSSDVFYLCEHCADKL